MSENKSEWYKKWWGLIVAILFFPIFIIWYAWAKSNWSKNVKIAITLVAGIFILMSSTANSSTGTITTPNNTQTTNSNSETVQEPDTTSQPEQQTAEVDTKPQVPAEYKSALIKAESYATTMHMSKRGVYDQLVSEYGEKFTPEAAQYAIDKLVADWSKNALVKAKSYQENMAMSPAAIHDQLISEYGEKFTEAEADYAIQHLND